MTVRIGVLLSMFFLCGKALAMSGSFIMVGNASIALKEIPTISPDSVLVSTSDAIDEDDYDLEYTTYPYTEQDIEDIETDGEFDEYIFVSTFPVVEPDSENFGGDGKLTLVRKDTGEILTVEYRDKDGHYIDDAFEQLSYIMRCSLEGKQTKTPKKLIEILDAIEDKYAKKGLVLLSGYRTKDLNEEIPGAAKRSLHMLGWAADIKIIGVPTRKIKDLAVKLKAGGVGYYPAMGFVHIDIGENRYWQKLPRKAKYKKIARKKKT